MISFVNAKLNLGLNVTARRPDGYHELETLFYPLGLYNGTVLNPEPFNDIIEIHLLENTREDEFSFTGNTINCPLDANLVVKAVRLFRAALSDKGEKIDETNNGIRLWLDKHIPDGAGLGGGSADASFTLTALNTLHNNPFSKNELIALAASLGADCPFFIENRPVLARGIGEIMTRVELDLFAYWALVVKPDIYISTREAFSGITPNMPEKSIEEIVKHPVEEWECRGLKNDFENHIFEIFPQLLYIKRALKEAGASYAAMSGSGSSIFGLFSSKPSQDIELALKKNFSEVCPSTFISKL